ncbi:unnamed protein product, partial [Symbiodinium microadriaticum]
MDASLRGPSLQEIVLADRSVWASVSELIRDHGWSLSDSLNEIAFCRGEMANLLQARPRPPKPPPGPSGGGKGDRKRTYSADGPGSVSDPSTTTGKGDSPAKPKDKAKAKATANPPPKGFDPSWFRTGKKHVCVSRSGNARKKTVASSMAALFRLPTARPVVSRTPPWTMASLARLEPVDVLVGPAHDLQNDSTFQNLQPKSWKRQRFCIPVLVTCCIWWQVLAWCRLAAPFMATVAACQVGLQLHKSWSFCCNDASVSQLASVCPHPIGFHVALSGKRAADGSFLTRNTAAYPASLAQSLAKMAAPWLSTETSGVAPVPLATWHSLLPARLPWPDLKHRVEDGAGTCSTARPDPAKFADPFRSLRTSWSRRFLRDGIAVRIAKALTSGSREPPLSESEL